MKRPPLLAPIVVLGASVAAAAVQARTLDRKSAVRAAASENPQVAAARAQEAALQAQAQTSRWVARLWAKRKKPRSTRRSSRRPRQSRPKPRRSSSDPLISRTIAKDTQ